jgi:hypothetical protein
MQHNEAIERKAAERYVMRELPVELRDAYEEHFFDCAECAADIKAATIFAETSREIFADEGRRAAADMNKEYGSGWSRWLRPAFALPVFAMPVLALLLVMIGYQNLVTIPKAKQEAARAPQSNAAQIIVSQAFAASFRLQGSTRGEASTTVVAVRADDSFALDFDFTPSQTADSYLGELQDPSGHTVLSVKLPAEMANKEVHVMVPGGLLHAGTYVLVISGVSAAQNPRENRQAVARLAFTVEIHS